MVTWVVFRDRGAFGRYAAQRPLLGALGGVMAVATYSATLWAMTVAPVAMVAALRESSILFVVVISAWVLKERVDGRRLALVCAIAGGAMVLRLA
jgi:drug/metabolite transporter (DMT)-like permease